MKRMALVVGLMVLLGACSDATIRAYELGPSANPPLDPGLTAYCDLHKGVWPCQHQ